MCGSYLYEVSDFIINIDNIINRSKGEYAIHATLMKQTSLRLMNWLLSLKLVTISFIIAVSK